ncbi:type IVB secretion system protein IcmH/DotU [Janthinobacterium lividum]|uniref:type IVB secretion system protein IcmH/DotU n=1 Tax=Janthinobacterium lividum TaxID=29581 RepID=UPI0014094907|nr:type IVB secretion system protein IcmH/DotU [Janthinobacterium lividum]NHQ91362.1 DotU family type IV/VI secretion system protein [Janthinobacterium lividum]
MHSTAPPSLMSGSQAAYASSTAAGPGTEQTLMDLMYDGFYALFMLKNGSGPQDNADFISKMTHFLDEFSRGAKKQGASADDIDAAKYAFCAAVDEIILRSPYSIRDEWARRPLQLVLFGDQLAGENFFIRLEALRARGSAHLQALEVFHMCLLLGFQGRYILEGPEKLNYLTARLGDEIAQMKGKKTGFAPHAERPDQIIHKLRNNVPPWVLCSVFALICALGYLGLRTMLAKQTEAQINAYNDIVKLAPRVANLSITLP